MLVLCKKLHICTYDQQNFSGDRLPFGNPWPPLVPKVEVPEPPLLRVRARLLPVYTLVHGQLAFHDADTDILARISLSVGVCVGVVEFQLNCTCCCNATGRGWNFAEKESAKETVHMAAWRHEEAGICECATTLCCATAVAVLSL